MGGVLAPERLALPRAAADGDLRHPAEVELMDIRVAARMSMRRQSAGTSRAARRQERHTCPAPIRISTWSSLWRMAQSTSSRSPAQSLASSAAGAGAGAGPLRPRRPRRRREDEVEEGCVAPWGWG